VSFIFPANNFYFIILFKFRNNYYRLSIKDNRFICVLTKDLSFYSIVVKINKISELKDQITLSNGFTKLVNHKEYKFLDFVKLNFDKTIEKNMEKTNILISFKNNVVIKPIDTVDLKKVYNDGLIYNPSELLLKELQ